MANKIREVFLEGCNKVLVTRKPITFNGEPAFYIHFEPLIGQQDELYAAKQVRDDESGNHVIMTFQEFCNMGDDITSDHISAFIQKQSTRKKWAVYRSDES